MRAVERYCFGSNYEQHGTHNMTATQRRACLALGSMAGKLHKANPQESERLVSHLERWLGKKPKGEEWIFVLRLLVLNPYAAGG